MSKTHRVNKYEGLYLCVGKAHHPQTLPIPFGRGLAQTVTTGQDWTLLKRSENSLHAGTRSHQEFGLNINPATDVRGYSQEEAGTSPPLLETSHLT